MKRKGYVSLFLCIILSLCLLASCSAASDNKGAAMEDSPYYGSGAVVEDTEANLSGSSSEKQPVEQKIIQNLYLTLEVEDVEASYQTLLDKAISLGGYEFSRNYSKSGDYQSLHAVVKVPSDQLSAFSNDAGKIGNVVSNELTSEDISESYYDAQTRLTTMEKTLEKYYEFLTQAKSLDEQLSITKQIDELTYEIEALKGRLSKWDNQVNYATVTLNIYQYDDPSIKKEEIQWDSLSLDDMWYLIRSGFAGFTSAIISMLQWIVIAIASTCVISVPAIILIVVLILRHRKKKKAQKEAWAKQLAAQQKAMQEAAAAQQAAQEQPPMQ